jgi:hypothetical protein
MQDTQDKVKVAQDQAVAAWAKWVAANDSCREAYYTFMKAVGGEGEAYARYTEACLNRDAYYAEAMEAAQVYWRQDCHAAANLNELRYN